MFLFMCYDHKEQRGALETLIVQNGGKFSDALEADGTTHLVAKNNFRSEKYNAALDWNIKVVSIDWIVSCVRSKCMKHLISLFLFYYLLMSVLFMDSLAQRSRIPSSQS